MTQNDATLTNYCIKIANEQRNKIFILLLKVYKLISNNLLLSSYTLNKIVFLFIVKRQPEIITEIYLRCLIIIIIIIIVIWLVNKQNSNKFFILNIIHRSIGGHK